jgi:hypothetical protein
MPSLPLYYKVRFYDDIGGGMCGGLIKGEDKPERKLAELMERELGCGGYVDQQKLRLFLLAYWDRVCALAHQIHDEKQ